MKFTRQTLGTVLLFGSLWLCVFSCTTTTYAADANGPSVLPDKDWWVMIGPKPERDKGKLEAQAQRINTLFPTLQAELINTSEFFWLPQNQWGVFIGPEEQKTQADAVLKNVRRIQKEAKLVQTARRSPRPMPWFTGSWLLTWPNGNLNAMKLTVSRDSYVVTGTILNGTDAHCGVSGKCSSTSKATLSVSCPTSGLSFDMSLTLEDMDTGSGTFYLKGQQGPLTFTRN